MARILQDCRPDEAMRGDVDQPHVDQASPEVEPTADEQRRERQSGLFGRGLLYVIVFLMVTKPG